MQPAKVSVEHVEHRPDHKENAERRMLYAPPTRTLLWKAATADVQHRLACGHPGATGMQKPMWPPGCDRPPSLDSYIKTCMQPARVSVEHVEHRPDHKENAERRM